MSSQSIPDSKFQYALLKVIKALSTAPAQILFYGLALLAIAMLGGAVLPAGLEMLATTVGVNVLSNMLERIAKGENVPDDTIREILEDAIRNSGIENQSINHDLQRQIAHLFRKFDLLNYAIQNGESSILNLLNENGLTLRDLSKDVAILIEQNEEIRKAIQNIAAPQETASIGSQSLAAWNYSTALVDQNIEKEIEILRKSRFFAEFDKVKYSQNLVKKIIEGEYFGGTDSVKSRALAWGARILSHTEEFEKAEEYLQLSKNLGNSPEIEIAEAFILSQKNDKSSALATLARIDLPSARSAALMIVAKIDGPQGAIDWFSLVDFTLSDLDSDGKYSLLTYYLHVNNWEEAQRCLSSISTEDMHISPTLNRIVAITHLIKVIPSEFRPIVLTQLPFEVASFPLSSVGDSIVTRRLARLHFVNAAHVEYQLNCPQIATIDDDFALWLELKDPDEFHQGKQKLEEKLRDQKTGLHFVHFAMQFGIDLDLMSIEREIERQTVLNGGATQDIASARLAIALGQDSPVKIANYLSKHRDELLKLVTPRYLLFLQVEIFSRAGNYEKAHEYLEDLIKEGITKDEENSLRRKIADAQGSDPIEAQKELFKETDSLFDLVSLVDELQAKNNWDGVSEYGQILFERTHSLKDAEKLATALYKAQKTDQLVEFIKANLELLPQSTNLQMLYCWALYIEGELLEARTQLNEMRIDHDDAAYRTLQVNIAIALGDKNSLVAYVTNEYQEKDKRSAQELIGVAQLALNLGLHLAKELIFAAANKGNEDANILTAAFLLASNAGLDDDEEVYLWFHKAANLSGPDGPIQVMNLKDIVNFDPDWNRRVHETMQLLRHGDIPMFLAAQSQNRSLINLMLFTAVANMSENDPRRRVPIPAYNGRRQAALLPIHGKLGVEATALFTLGFLNLLDKVFEVFETIYVPHTTLGWLFEEKQKITFHQPIQITKAHEMLKFLGSDTIERLSPSVAPNSDLATQVGDELAQLISEAEKERDDGVQHIVIRSSPVYRISSLMEEEADLTAHEAVISSCQAVVDKLRQNGRITVKEENKARAYLQFHEKPWTHQPEISNGAILYLDGLSVSYFFHLGILDKLRPAGFRVIVSPDVISQNNQLITYESIADEAKEVVERIQSTINLQIKTGKVKTGKKPINDAPEEQAMYGHPTYGVFSLARKCDVIIVDDRSINQHVYIEDGGVQTPVFSTLDLIDSLVSVGFITDEEYVEYKTQLRRAGYFFFPITATEVASHLRASVVMDGQIIETAELKAIRENFLRVEMSDWLKIPEEKFWLDSSLISFTQALKDLWRPEAEPSDILVRSYWIINQLEFRGWAHCLTKEDGEVFIKIGRGALIMLLLVVPHDVPGKIKEQYWKLIEETILAPIKEQEPNLFSSIVEWYRKMIEVIVNNNFGELIRKSMNHPLLLSLVVQKILDLIPPLIRKTLLETVSFRNDYGLKTEAVLSINGIGNQFQRSDLYDAIRKVLSGSTTVEVSDNTGQVWEVKNESSEEEYPKLFLFKNKQQLILPDFTALSPNSVIRLHFFDKAAFTVNLPREVQDLWRGTLSERSLDDDEFESFQDEFLETPISIARSLRDEIINEQLRISTLVPPSRKYFERLIGAYDESASIHAYAVGSGKRHFDQLSLWHPYDGFLFSLFLSSHSSLTDEINMDHLSNEDLIHAYDFVDKNGDRISQLGALEVGFRILALHPEIETSLINLFEQIRDEDLYGQSSQFRLLSNLFMFVDGELSRTRLLSFAPPFYRRLASLSQAALICQQLLNLNFDFDNFSQWAFNNRAEQYYMQSLADMRTDPRWNPALVQPSQLKDEFLGRITISAKKYEQNLKDSKLSSLILEISPESIHSKDCLNYFLPGPLEGNEQSPLPLPKEFAEIIESQLIEKDGGPFSFVGLLNASLIYQIDASQAEIAARALKLANYRLKKIEDHSQLLTILNGLANVSAVTRSAELADELRILVRVYRQDPQYSLSIWEAIEIGLVAAASHADQSSWRDFVGGWLTELAFGKLANDEGLVLRSRLRCLIHAVPELWITCGKADAALAAYNTSKLK